MTRIIVITNVTYNNDVIDQLSDDVTITTLLKISLFKTFINILISYNGL